MVNHRRDEQKKNLTNLICETIIIEIFKIFTQHRKCSALQLYKIIKKYTKKFT